MLVSLPRLIPLVILRGSGETTASLARLAAESGVRTLAHAEGGGVLSAIAEAYYRISHEEGLGMGDVKMLAMVGAFIGWKLTLLTLIMASFSGTLIGVALIVSKRGGLKYALPFGTFLALGAAVSATVGSSILDWYLGLL